jgi:cobalt-zinc-cadmium resistance protein CzcA
MGVTLLEIFDALQTNNSVAGGAYIEKQNQSYFIRGDGLVKSVADIEKIVVRNRGGLPILVRDVATVQYGSANRFGAITANGEGEKVMGQIMMLKNANSQKVINKVKMRVEEIQRTLPEGVFINPILERSELLEKTTKTVMENLIFGSLIVLFIVIIILGNLRSGLVIASMIPLSLLFTISMMYIFGIDANLMSLGALDFGIIIDGAVIIVEFIAIRLTVSRQQIEHEKGGERQRIIDQITFNGASKMMNSAIFGQLIILIVFIPILSLTGVEGKMFRPMALSFSFALLGAMFFGLTWLPVASSLFLKPEKTTTGFSLAKWIMGIAQRSYSPIMEWSYRHKKIVLGLAFASLVGTGYLFSRMGGEFVPTLDEGDFVIQPVLKTGTSLSKTIETTTQMENILINSFTEVDQIVCRIGAAEVPTDPMSMEEIDMIIKLKPRKEWVNAKSKEELADKFKSALSVIPGIDYEFTQPIEMRFNELITGVRADLAIKIFGDDLDVLNEKALVVKQLIDDVPGAADVIMEKTAGLPQMSVSYKRDKIAMYGLNIEALNKYLVMAFGGELAGNVFEGEKRFDMVIRYQRNSRTDIENIRNLWVDLPNGQQIPLSEVAEIDYASGPAKISHDNTHRRVVVSVNVRNRDLQSVVGDIQNILDRELMLPDGYYIEYGGQFENLMNASNRLKVAVPIALLLIFVFLHFAFGSIREAAMVFSAVPLSVVGGVFLLWIRGMPFSISAGVGFIALFGVAVLNGIVLIEHLKELKSQGVHNMHDRIMRATRERLRPVLLTASAAALGFLPMAIATSAGAEVQRPLATVVIGGLITSTMLTMIALPLLYAIFDNVTGVRLFPFRLIRRKLLPVILLLIIPGVGLKAQSIEFTLPVAIETALNKNHEIQASRALLDEAHALIPTAFTIDKTTVYYGYDQNNIAENGYPLGIIGVEQQFHFPTVYSSQRKANSFYASMFENELVQKKKQLEKEVTQVYYLIIYFKNKQEHYRLVDSIYSNFESNAQTSYTIGAITRLELLHARSKQNQLKIQLSQLLRDMESGQCRLMALMQVDSLPAIPLQPLSLLEIHNNGVGNDPGFLHKLNYVNWQEANLKTEMNALLPDINLGYFNGSNNRPDARNYYGFQVGIALPLFYGAQKAKIKAGNFAVEAAENMKENYRIRYHTKIDELANGLSKFFDAISYYQNEGKTLSNEILKVAQVSYKAGEIDFFRFVQSVDTALQIEMDYLDNLLQYNNAVLEINYLTF